jgi:hypothetical protein
MVAVPCPLCDGSDYTIIAEKDFYGLPVNNVVCNFCGMLYQNPRLSGAALQKLYANEYRDLDRVKPSSDDYFELERDKAQAQMEFLAAHGLEEHVRGKLIIEIGCGVGGAAIFY